MRRKLVAAVVALIVASGARQSAHGDGSGSLSTADSADSVGTSLAEAKSCQGLQAES